MGIFQLSRLLEGLNQYWSERERWDHAASQQFPPLGSTELHQLIHSHMESHVLAPHAL